MKKLTKRDKELLVSGVDAIELGFQAVRFSDAKKVYLKIVNGRYFRDSESNRIDAIRSAMHAVAMGNIHEYGNAMHAVHETIAKRKRACKK
jgi:hypothetical protein